MVCVWGGGRVGVAQIYRSQSHQDAEGEVAAIAQVDDDRRRQDVG